MDRKSLLQMMPKKPEENKIPKRPQKDKLLRATDLYGENPKTPAAKVLDGLKTLYPTVTTLGMDIFGEKYIPKVDDSYVMYATEALIPYVCLNKWHSKKGIVMPSISGKEPPPTLNLAKYVDSVKNFYSTFMHLFPHSQRQYNKCLAPYVESGEFFNSDFKVPPPEVIFGEYLSENEIYFCLFARAAELRFRVDFETKGHLRHENLSLNTECVFTPEELGLLTGVSQQTVINYNIMRSVNIDPNDPNLVKEKDTNDLYSVTQSVLPGNPEFQDLKTGRVTHELTKVYEHEQALLYLNYHKKYHHTKFLDTPTD